MLRESLKTEYEEFWDKIMEEDLSYAIDHGIVVSNLAYLVSKEMGLEEDFCYLMAEAGMVHDIGKLKISKYVYGRRKDSLLIEEMKYVRMHSTYGQRILRSFGYPDLVADAVYHHHENYDGSGYPTHLKGEQIPLGARILRVCDVFAALTSKRPYREAFDVETAIELMIDEVKNFDMEVFLSFLRVVNSQEFYRRFYGDAEMEPLYTKKCILSVQS